MFQLLNPIWLLAIGGIIIPLAIHLWSVKKGKTLKIGSIQLLGESSRQNARSLRLLDLLLLFLRCLMLVILALLLAGPIFNQHIPEGKLKGWVLIGEAEAKDTYSNFKNEIDSLCSLGYELHYLNPGFKEIDIEDLRKGNIAVKPDLKPELSYWSLIKALDKQLPSNTKSYIFTPNLLYRFAGERPKSNSKIIWETYIPVNSVYNRIKSAYFTSADSLRLILAHSQPSGNSYTFENTSVNDLNPAYQLYQENQPTIRFKNTGALKTIDSSAVVIDTSVIRIALFTDKHTSDMSYLKAGLEAVKTFSQRRISIETYTDQAKIPAGLNWLFWLSEFPLPEKGSKPAPHIFSYEKGKVLTPNSSVIVFAEGVSAEKQNLSLYKTTVPAKTVQADQAIWEDETGNSVLSFITHENFSEYKFYSRFDPEWNDLVWSAEFPELLLSLVLNDLEKSAGLNSVYYDPDRRTIDRQQINPVITEKTPDKSAKAATSQTGLEHFFWLLLISLFALERLVSYTQKTRVGNG